MKNQQKTSSQENEEGLLKEHCRFPQEWFSVDQPRIRLFSKMSHEWDKNAVILTRITKCFSWGILISPAISLQRDGEITKWLALSVAGRGKIWFRNHSYFLRANTQVLVFEKWCEEKGTKCYRKNFIFKKPMNCVFIAPSYRSGNWGLEMLNNLPWVTKVRKFWNENLLSFLGSPSYWFLWHILCLLGFNTLSSHPNQCGSVVSAPTCKPEGHQLVGFPSGHGPGLWARAPVGGKL